MSTPEAGILQRLYALLSLVRTSDMLEDVESLELRRRSVCRYRLSGAAPENSMARS